MIATDIFDKDHGAFRKARWAKAFDEGNASNEDDSAEALDRKATIVLEHLIQAADIHHTMQSWVVFEKWSNRLFEERGGIETNTL